MSRMLEFAALKNFLQPRGFVIDGTVSKLHYRFTVGLLFLFCLLVTSRQYFGDPISCMPSTANEILQAVIDTYCWIHATFTVPTAYGKKLGVQIPHEGIGTSESEDDRVYHKYYQWVWFVILLQTVLFYVPHFIWKTLENDTVKKIILELNLPVPQDEKKRCENCNLLADYLYNTKRSRRWYVIKFFTCEILNFFNVVIQMYLINTFLGGEFTTYGLQVIEFTETDQQNRTDPMIRIFPRVTKCTFQKYGPTGDVQKHDVLCILPLNIVNEKIYVIMWFWFVALAVVSGLWLVFCLAVSVCVKGRFYVLLGMNGLLDKGELISVLQIMGIGDWFLLYLLCRNMDSLNFKKVLHRLSNLSSGKICNKSEEKNFDISVA